MIYPWWYYKTFIWINWLVDQQKKQKEKQDKAAAQIMLYFKFTVAAVDQWN